jgi:hypothetical protein
LGSTSVSSFAAAEAYVHSVEEWCRAVGATINEISYQERRLFLSSLKMKATAYRRDAQPYHYTIECDIGKLRAPLNTLRLPVFTNKDTDALLHCDGTNKFVLWAQAINVLGHK